ncbi:MliC family protein [Paraherbaspirillum soli]|uniref:MliC family protein n=1 Tax=Paraherbaspirillum soli TaxID=631222 RepID=A0ABW0M890_9BURK
MKFSSSVLAAILLPLSINAAVAQSAEAQDDAPNDSSAASYRCEGGKKMQVAYVNLKDGKSIAVLYYKGRLIPMHQGVSGSGARYVADDEQNSYRWHTKGKMGILSFKVAGASAKEKTIFRDCNQVSPSD